MQPNEFDKLYGKVKSLNELLWEYRVNGPVVDQWLSNFNGKIASEEIERLHALYLLSKFLFFGRNEIRELLRAMFQDLIRQPLMVNARTQQTDPDDFSAIHEEFEAEIDKTRFIGLGNPAESGTHILYHFRQVNKIPSAYFVNPHDLFTGKLNDSQTLWNSPSVTRLIFIDDFCGTGHQAEEMGRKYVSLMRDVATRCSVDISVWYLTLIATSDGLEYLRGSKWFDRVESVSELDSSYRVFDDKSQFYTTAPSGCTRVEAKEIAKKYGELLWPNDPLGYGCSQLLIGFHHNVPDNTLPIITQARASLPWFPVFPRDEKY